MREAGTGAAGAVESEGESRGHAEGVGGGSSPPPPRGLDLFGSPMAGPLLRNPLAQRLAQGTLLVGYVALVWLGWGLDAIPGVPELHPRMYTHATTLLFWVVWFMGLVFVVPVAGRAWCGVCPVGAAADFLGRRGLGLAWPRWIGAGTGAVVLFAAGIGAVALADVHMSPHRTALVVGAVGALAVLCSLLFRRSAFCRGLCPVGSVLHLYSRHAPVAVGTRDPALCSSCRDHSCTATGREWRRWDLGNWVFQRKLHRAGCPAALYPPDMDQGACLLCLRCLRNCSRGNLGLFWGRRPEGRALDPARTALLVLILGVVTLALLRTWPDAWETLTPGVSVQPWVAALWLGLALPAAALFAPLLLAAVGRAARGSPAEPPGAAGEPRPRPRPGGLGSRRTAGWFAAAFVGLALGGHAALALVKLNAKAAYVPYLVYDPSGAATYLAVYVSRVLPVPDLLLPLPYLRWAGLACLGLGAVAGGRELSRRWPGGASRVVWVLYAGTFVALAGLYGAALVHWLFPGRG